MRYADVIVDIQSEQVDRVFTYAVPDGVSLEAGYRVLAPFGPRRVEGYVVSVSAHTDLPEEKIRSIIRALEDYPAILPELIELAQWMRQRYHCTLSEALRLMIPAQLRAERVREKHVRVASLCISGEAIAAEKARRARAPRQVRVIELLENGPLPAPVIAASVAGAAGVLNALAKQGVVRLEAAEALRRPYEALDARRVDEPALTPAQARAVARINREMDAGGGRFLLFGVTGSGKTEVYISAIRHALEMGGTAIVLVPEIALTPQMVDWFRARFGDDAAVLHSRLSAGERFDEWRRLRSGRARVAIGARSAVFAPLAHVKLIVVDEEHEHTYRSEKRPCYDAREVAARRLEHTRGALVLGSATPSIASFMRTMPSVRPENRLALLELSERVNGRPLPSIEIVDMRRELAGGNRHIFSGALRGALEKCLSAGNQAILFINRRGHSTFVSCRACGYVEKCDSCDVTMTYHQSENLLKCHYCDAVRLPPKACPNCGSPFIRYFGAGTQKIEEEMHSLFPHTVTARMDIDTTRGKDKHEKILSAFGRGEAQVLIGTQMIAKGLDFPNVTLVGVVAADMTLNLPDYRSAERTFQLLTQVAGRAGRAQTPGHVVIQTYDPEHYAITLAARQDYRAFYQQEAKYRRRGLYPPFTVLARLLVTSQSEQDCRVLAERMERELAQWLESEGDLKQDVVQMRALEAPLKKLRGENRYQVFIKMYARGDTGRILSRMEELARREAPGCRVELEINPANML